MFLQFKQPSNLNALAFTLSKVQEVIFGKNKTYIEIPRNSFELMLTGCQSHENKKYIGNSYFF